VTDGQANKLYTPEAQQKVVSRGIATGLRAPTQAYGVLQNSAVFNMLQQAAKRGIPNAPPFLMSVIETVASKSAPTSFKLFKELETMDKVAQHNPEQEAADEVTMLKAEVAKLKEENERLKREID